MFTGLIEGVGRLAAREMRGGDARLRIDVGTLPWGTGADVRMGESISVNGTCLTVVAFDDTGFEADASNETLGLTTLGEVDVGRALNLERAMRPTDRLGGHLVSGHVDGVGTVKRIAAAGTSRVVTVKAPAGLAKYIARKGSITVNGVSLTVNAIKRAEFTVNLIPHTLSASNLGALRAGDRVNVEVDMLARYMERLRGGG